MTSTTWTEAAVILEGAEPLVLEAEGRNKGGLCRESVRRRPSGRAHRRDHLRALGRRRVS
jgi:hypothetical protein